MRQLSESTWILEGPTNIGFIEKDKDILLIDSGNDKESGRKINKILNERGWSLKAIFNTHSNADHMGGNDFLQRKHNCPVYSSKIENCFIHYPQLETAFLWGGREVKELRNKFFQAEPSQVTRLCEENEFIEGRLKAITLKGHFMNMLGGETEDGVLFLADCIFGEEILKKYKIPFIFHVEEYKKTLTAIQNIDADYYVPSHGPVLENIVPLARFNLEVVEKIETTLLSILDREKCFEDILQELCNAYEIELNTGQYALVGSTIRSFLSFLNEDGKIQYRFKGNRMLWESP